MNPLEELERIHKEATPGPWGWRGHSKYGFDLRQIDPPQNFAMMFARLGMRGGQPEFPVVHDGDRFSTMTKASELCISEVTYADRVVDIAAPNARLIALSRNIVGPVIELARAVEAYRAPMAPMVTWKDMLRAHDALLRAIESEVSR